MQLPKLSTMPPDFLASMEAYVAEAPRQLPAAGEAPAPAATKVGCCAGGLATVSTPTCSSCRPVLEGAGVAILARSAPSPPACLACSARPCARASCCRRLLGPSAPALAPLLLLLWRLLQRRLATRAWCCRCPRALLWWPATAPTLAALALPRLPPLPAPLHSQTCWGMPRWRAAKPAAPPAKLLPHPSRRPRRWTCSATWTSAGRRRQAQHPPLLPLPAPTPLPTCPRPPRLPLLRPRSSSQPRGPPTPLASPALLQQPPPPAALAALQGLSGPLPRCRQPRRSCSSPPGPCSRRSSSQPTAHTVAATVADMARRCPRLQAALPPTWRSPATTPLLALAHPRRLPRLPRARLLVATGVPPRQAQLQRHMEQVGCQWSSPVAIHLAVSGGHQSCLLHA